MCGKEGRWEAFLKQTVGVLVALFGGRVSDVYVDKVGTTRQSGVLGVHPVVSTQIANDEQEQQKMAD